MRDSTVLAEYVDILAKNENTLECIQKSLEKLWDSYQIARMEMTFKVPPNVFTPDGIDTGGSFAMPGQVADEQLVFTKTCTTGEGGAVNVNMYRGHGCEAWTESEEMDLDMILNILFFHCGRFRLIQQISNSMLTDVVTGIPNTQGFLRSVEKIYEEKRITKYNSFCFNLKRFGLINKKFGKNEADEIMCRYTRLLRDFIDEDEHIGRLGGDNFVALIKKEKTDDFIQFLSGATTYGMLGERQSTVALPATAGIYEIDASISHYERVISNGAVALNIARNVTKQSYVFFTTELNERVNNEKKILGSFTQALKDREFQVYYQPKVETDTYHLIGAEALVRWYRNDKLISPCEFIPIIERDGSICNLDFYVLDQVCRDLREWLDSGVEPVRVSVNFSRKHLSNPEFANKIQSVLRQYHIDPQYIEVEVTETTDEEEQGLLSAFVNRMKDSQIAVSIDDFGTGYSSLNILRTFPVEILKIDKSFIDQGIDEETDHIVLSNIIHMAKQLNMDVVSEGVENWKQVEFLHDMECNIVQGFLFDKPMPKVEFEQRIQNKQYDITQIVDYAE